MALTNKDIEHIANLARLEISDSEIEDYRGKLGSILDYVTKLQEVDTEGVEELAHGAGLTNVLHDDKVSGCEKDTRDRIIEEFPKREGDLLEVQAVFEERTE